MTTPCVPYRWVELLSLDDVVTFMELERLPAYGFTGATLWSSFMNHGLDSYWYTIPVVYRRFPEFNEVRDLNRIKEGAEFLTEFIRRAHRLGLTVQHNYDLCNFVGGPPTNTGSAFDVNRAALKQVHPEWLNEYDEADFSKDCWYEFMEAEVEDFLTQFPGLDGLYCWNCENSLFTPSFLHHQSIPHGEIVRRATKVVYDVCRRQGVLMTHDLHTIGGDVEVTEAIIAAAAEYPELMLGADCTYGDWQFFLPTTPWLDKMRAHNRIYVGFDAAGEYFGKGKVLGVWPNWMIRHFTDAKAFTPTCVTVRTEIWSRGISAFASPFLELNVRTLMTLAIQGEIDLDAELEAWWRDHFDGPWSPGVKELILRLESLQANITHINYSGCTNSSTAFPGSILLANGKVAFFEQFAEPGARFDAIPANWRLKAGDTVKPFAVLRQEKLDGMALCEDAVEKLEHLGLPEETRRLLETRFLQARDVAGAYLYLLDAAHALNEQIGEYRDNTLPDPKAALREALRHLRALADDMDARWGASFYDEFTLAMRTSAVSIPPVYLPEGKA